MKTDNKRVTNKQLQKEIDKLSKKLKTMDITIKLDKEDLTDKHGDLEYIYYIWQKPNDSTWISIFEVVFDDGTCECCGQIRYEKDDSKCIFVGKPEYLIEKYKQNTND